MGHIIGAEVLKLVSTFLQKEVKFWTVLNWIRPGSSGSHWPCGLRRKSSAARLLRLWVRIPPGHGCLSVVSVVCCQVEVSATD